MFIAAQYSSGGEEDDEDHVRLDAHGRPGRGHCEQGASYDQEDGSRHTDPARQQFQTRGHDKQENDELYRRHVSSILVCAF